MLSFAFGDFATLTLLGFSRLFSSYIHDMKFLNCQFSHITVIYIIYIYQSIYLGQYEVIYYEGLTHNYEDWEVPWFAVCKLAAQENQWCSSNPCSKTWKSEGHWCRLWPMSEGLRARGINVRGQKIVIPVQAERKFTLPLPFCYIQALTRPP